MRTALALCFVVCIIGTISACSPRRIAAYPLNETQVEQAVLAEYYLLRNYFEATVAPFGVEPMAKRCTNLAMYHCISKPNITPKPASIAFMNGKCIDYGCVTNEKKEQIVSKAQAKFNAEKLEIEKRAKKLLTVAKHRPLTQQQREEAIRYRVQQLLKPKAPIMGGGLCPPVCPFTLVTKCDAETKRIVFGVENMRCERAACVLAHVADFIEREAKKRATPSRA
jgi:hypothetical protein